MVRADMRVLALVSLIVLAVYLLTMAGRLTSGDGEAVYQTTRALITQRQLSIDPRPETAEGRGGRWYSKYGLGQSLIQAPFFVAGHMAAKLAGAGDDRPARFAVGMANSFVTAALVTVFWLTTRILGAGRGGATAAALVLAFSTLAWPYARADFSEPLQATTLLLALYALIRWRRTPALGWAALAGASAGLAVLAKVASVVLLPALGLYAAAALWQRYGRSRQVRAALMAMVAAGAPFALLVSVQLALNLYRFGSLSEFGYGSEPAFGFTTPLHLGIWYLLASSGKGLLWYAPPVIAGILLLPWLARRYPLEALAAGLVFAFELLYFARWWAWHGDWAWGPRYMVITVPFILLALGPYFSAWRSWPAVVRGSSLALVAAGVAVSFLGVAIDYGGYYSIVGSQLGRGVDVKEARLVPSFSPILGHAWLARATWHDTIASLGSRGAERGIHNARHNPALAEHPWAGTHPDLVPEAPERALGFDFWFTAPRQRTRFVEYWSWLVAGWLTFAVPPLARGLWRELAPSDTPVEVPATGLLTSNVGTVPAWQR